MSRHYLVSAARMPDTRQAAAGNRTAGDAISRALGRAVVLAYLDEVDMVLVMTVAHGFCGQPFLAEQLQAVSQVRQWIAASGRDVNAEVDGGIKPVAACRPSRHAPTCSGQHPILFIAVPRRYSVLGTMVPSQVGRDHRPIDEHIQGQCQRQQ